MMPDRRRSAALRLAARLGPYVKAEGALLAGSAAALIAEVGLQALEPWPLKFVFDRALLRNGTTPLPVWGLTPSTLVLLSAAALLVIVSLRAVAGYINTLGLALVGNRVLTELRTDLYRHLQCLSLAFHARSRGGDLTLRVVSDVGTLKDVAVTAILPLLANALTFVVMLGGMFWLNWRLALAVLAVLPLFVLRTRRQSQRIHEASRRQRTQQGAMAATAAESLSAIRVVQTLSLEGTFERAFAGTNRGDLKTAVRAKRLEAGLERSVDILVGVCTALVLFLGARLVLLRSLTPGELLVFLSYLKSAFKPAKDLAKYTARLAKAAAAGERVIDLLDLRPDVEDLPDARPAPRLNGQLQFENLSFSYDAESLVLRNFNLTVEPGEQVAIVGPSGVGKSTVAALLLRLYDARDGRVLLDGVDVREYTLASIRAQMSVVLQDTALFATTVRENIAIAAPDAADEAIEAAALTANAHGFIAALPGGYTTPIGERGATLSHGQRQRIALARAAVRQSPILVLDEPTTALDGDSAREVIAAFRRLARGRTTLLITHDLELAARADRIVVLEDGRIVEEGTHAELLRKHGSYARLYRLQRAGLAAVKEEHAHAV